MNKHILLVVPDEQHYLRDLCTIVLDRAGYRVIQTRSQAEAGDIFASRFHEFDLVIINKTLEDRDAGMRLMDFIHEIIADFPCILMTSGPGIVEVKDCDRVLYKVFTNEDLVRIAGEVISEKTERDRKKFEK